MSIGLVLDPWWGWSLCCYQALKNLDWTMSKLFVVSVSIFFRDLWDSWFLILYATLFVHIKNHKIMHYVMESSLKVLGQLSYLNNNFWCSHQYSLLMTFKKDPNKISLMRCDREILKKWREIDIQLFSFIHLCLYFIVPKNILFMINANFRAKEMSVFSCIDHFLDHFHHLLAIFKGVAPQA